jgi:hypothetical protein
LDGAVCVAGSGIDCYLDDRDVGAPLRVDPKLEAGTKAFGISGLGDLAIAVGASANTTPTKAVVGPLEGPFAPPAGTFPPWTQNFNYWRHFDGGLITIGADGGANRTAYQLDARGWANGLVVGNQAALPFDDVILVPGSPSRLAARRGSSFLTADSEMFTNFAELYDIRASAFATFAGDVRVAVRRKAVGPPAVDRIYRSEAVASDGATAIELKAGSVWLRWTVDKKLGILGARDCADDTHLFATIVNF